LSPNSKNNNNVNQNYILTSIQKPYNPQISAATYITVSEVLFYREGVQLDRALLTFTNSSFAGYGQIIINGRVAGLFGDAFYANDAKFNTVFLSRGYPSDRWPSLNVTTPSSNIFDRIKVYYSQYGNTQVFLNTFISVWLYKENNAVPRLVFNSTFNALTKDSTCACYSFSGMTFPI
jgi:hypothetical protein